MPMDNDVRGWILTTISSIACLTGAAFICVDLVIRLFPGKRDFRIQDSNGFLSCSLSLSAGVMLFSALYKLLPESDESLEKGGFTPRPAAWILIACFLGGVWGIQLISRLMHLFMPSHVVDCDHTHDEDVEHQRSRAGSHANTKDDGMLERTPLLHRPTDLDQPITRRNTGQDMTGPGGISPLPMGTFHKPSLQARMTRKMTAFVSGEQDHCDGDGPCKGYSDPCAAECFRNINARGGTRAPTRTITAPGTRRPTLRHSASADPANFHDVAEERHDIDPKDPRNLSTNFGASHPNGAPGGHTHSAIYSPTSSIAGDPPPSHGAPSDTHHHHVPQNAFLSLSFQTSVAIVLHKLPEGFITYASNHANPDLGFNVFMALAIHNITEGFALALPIYLATSSRLRALLYSFVLGGFSQPLGAAIAAAWLKLAERGKGEYAPSDGIYGGLFAATAGILANVAINLLSQSFELSHSKGLCMFFVFVGMGVLGVSSALTA